MPDRPSLFSPASHVWLQSTAAQPSSEREMGSWVKILEPSPAEENSLSSLHCAHR